MTVQSSLATCWPMRSAEGGDALAVEVGFEPVADRFVQQDAGPAGAEHDGHLAGGRLHGVQLHDGLPRGFCGEVLGRLLVQEEVEIHASAAAGMAALRGAVVLARQRRDAHAGQRLPVEVEHAVAGGDHHLAQVVGIGRLHLEDARVVGARGAVGAFDQIDALVEAVSVGAVRTG